MLRQQFLDLLGPLREAVAATVEVLLIAYIVGFGHRLQAVEVEVVDWLIVTVTVFIHYGKRGAADIVLNTQHCTKLFYQRRLTHPHLAEEGKEALLAECIQQIPCHLGQLLYIMNLNFQLSTPN